MALLVSGCVGSGSDVTRSAFGFLGEAAPSPVDPAAPALSSQMEDGSQSEIIDALLNRQSILTGGPFDQVARAVLAANSRAAEAELRAATLRAEAADLNWLPTIGPSVSLSSLGAVVASLFVEQVLWDNGRKRAERAFAKADVEVAAVALAQDTNDRVLDALSLYLNAQAFGARAAVNQAGMERMEHFAYVMSERVRGGVSNRADLQVVTQKLDQMRADLIADQEAASAAMAELGAMSAEPLAGIAGLSPLAPPAPNAIPLAVIKAEAEAARSVAQARAARAGFLPGVTAGGTVSSDGTDVGLTVGAPNGFGFGTGASLRAIEAQEAAASARVGQMQEDTNRQLRALEAQLDALRRQEAEKAALAAAAAQNYDLFAAQLREGQRAVPEVVGVFETRIRAEREAVTVRYDVARIELRIAALLGVLVQGDRI